MAHGRCAAHAPISLMRMMSVVHITNPDGHRAAYRDMLASELGYTALTGPAKRYFFVLLRSRKVLFATLDGDIDRFLLIGFLRCLLLKPTCGLFVSPLRYLRKPVTFRERVRAWGFRVARHMPFVRVFSIIPHPVRPELSLVTRDWVHDPQLWDLPSLRSACLPETELSCRVLAKKGNRKVILFLGKGSKKKGLPDLVRLTAGLEHEVLVVVAGRVMSECERDASSLIERGMIVEGRFISDEELLSLYGVADRVWCVYRPEYDQASGVFGRAIQLGVTPIIRSGSVLEEYADFIGATVIKLAGNSDTHSEALKADILCSQKGDSDTRESLIEGFRNDALEKLVRALG